MGAFVTYLGASNQRVRSVFLGAWVTALAILAGSPSRGQQDLPRATPESVGVSSPRLKRIGEAIQRHIDEKHISGAVTLVARKGFVVHYRSAGSKISPPWRP